MQTSEDHYQQEGYIYAKDECLEAERFCRAPNAPQDCLVGVIEWSDAMLWKSAEKEGCVCRQFAGYCAATSHLVWARRDGVVSSVLTLSWAMHRTVCCTRCGRCKSAKVG